MSANADHRGIERATQIDVLGKDQRPSAARVLADAFHTDPMMEYLMPADSRRARALPLYFASVFRQAGRKGLIEVARQGGDIAAAIVSMPPGTYPLPLFVVFRQVVDRSVRWAGGVRARRAA